MLERRKFLKQSAALLGGAFVFSNCNTRKLHYPPGSIAGANSKVGHLLKKIPKQQQPTNIVKLDYVIVGGGVSALSAARYLKQQGIEKFTVLEMADQVGGNSVSGKNEISNYPRGAHYVPIPNNDLNAYMDFLASCGVITGYDNNNLPILNELYLCFAPQERLYIKGQWQEGIIPDFSLSLADRKEMQSFLKQMQQFREAKGTDGKYAFTFPSIESSQDPVYLALDQLNMQQWLKLQGYQSEALHWYCDYCCKDDFGLSYAQTSAWAGIHYFAARKGKAANAPAQSVLTWPEGNDWLVKQLKAQIQTHIQTNAMVLQVQLQQDEVWIDYLQLSNNQVNRFVAKQCIIATPQYVNTRILPDLNARNEMVKAICHYQPWMVANLRLPKPAERNGSGLSWDNVLYQGKGLGFVNATHQHTQVVQSQVNLTYYLPLTGQSASTERQLASSRTYEDWLQIVYEDLKMVYPSIDQQLLHAEIWVWGHGMIGPTPGYWSSNQLKQLRMPVDDKLYFAHSDLAGISVFEEAFYQGIEAAKKMLAI